MPAPQNAEAREVYEKERAHVLAPWTAWGKHDPMVVTKSEGVYLWDGDDNEYLDFTGQLVYTNVGHQHPRVVEAIKTQAETLCTIGPSNANDQRSQLAKMISDLLPDTLNKVFFTNGGTEANEHAVRMAREVTQAQFRDNALRMFDRVDANHDGRVDAEQAGEPHVVAGLLQHLSHSSVLGVLAGVDDAGDRAPHVEVGAACQRRAAQRARRAIRH